MQEAAARLARLLPQLTARILPEKGHVLYNLADKIVPFLTAEVGAA